MTPYPTLLASIQRSLPLRPCLPPGFQALPSLNRSPSTIEFPILFLSAADFHNNDYTKALTEPRKMSFLDCPPALLFLISASALTDNMKDAARYHDMLRDLLGEPTLEDARNYLTNMIPYADDLVETGMSGLTSVIESHPNPRP